MANVGVVACMDLLWQEAPPVEKAGDGSEEFRKELEKLATSVDSLADRSLTLFEYLRKMIGQPKLVNCLMGIQRLAVANEAAGARLLAALLDVSTAGERLLPRIRDFRSSRRVYLDFQSGRRNPDAVQQDWLTRLDKIIPPCEGFIKKRGLALPKGEPVAGQEAPWPLLRGVLSLLLGNVTAKEKIAATERVLLASLLNLEIEAWQERISHLAGAIDPFQVTAVMRVLPLLSESDAEIRDLRQLASWVAEGNDDAAFFSHISRADSVMDEKEQQRFSWTLTDHPGLGPLAELHIGLQESPLPVPQLGAAVGRLMALGHQLKLAGHRQTDLDLLAAARIANSHGTGNRLRLPLAAGKESILERVLNDPQSGDGLANWSLAGFRVEDGALVLDLPVLEVGESLWPDDLPAHGAREFATPARKEFRRETILPFVETDEQKSESADQLSTAEIKHLVMTSIQSTSVLLGFLRNKKITSIPGLVAAVATRTRSPLIIETIANTRELYTGFANRDVPLACLRNPCNASVKALRKFAHVKYISKIELRRMAADHAGMRREMIREIQAYLDTLA